MQINGALSGISIFVQQVSAMLETQQHTSQGQRSVRYRRVRRVGGVAGRSRRHVTREFDRFGTLLYARNDDPPPVVLSRLLKEITKLQFEGSKHHICCTRGGVATELAARLAHGARSLADALRSWLSTDQARQLQSHIEKGHLVLWLRLPTSEEFGRVCGRLVQATPHMVGLCNIKKNT